MRIGATITLNVRPDAARDALAELTGSSWMMSLPQQDSCFGHSTGRGRPGDPASGRGARMVAVTFGKPAVSTESGAPLTVRWESVEPGDEFTVLLDADLTVAPAATQACSTLTLAGVCRLPPGTLIACGYELARVQVTEAAREFISGVADAVTHSAVHSQEPGPGGQAWSWITGLPRTP